MSLKKLPLFAHSAQLFVHQWLSGASTFTCKTSGSTGTPKSINIARSQMTASAQQTIDSLHLPKGIDALLAMSADRIGGKMMLVRAMIGNWNLTITEASSDLVELLKAKRFEFTALVPLQVHMLIEKKSSALLESIDYVLIGGGAISLALEKVLNSFSNKIYHTYGMTETVSHIALRKISQQQCSPWFNVIGDTKISLSLDGCLSICGPTTNNTWVVTNDLAEIEGKSFKWLGRKDLVVNSGGIKFHIEGIENELEKLIPQELKTAFCIWKTPDPRFGERLICIVGSLKTIRFLKKHTPQLKKEFRDYAWPKEWYFIEKLQYTESGKIDRIHSFKGAELVSA